MKFGRFCEPLRNAEPAPAGGGAPAAVAPAAPAAATPAVSELAPASPAAPPADVFLGRARQDQRDWEAIKSSLEKQVPATQSELQAAPAAPVAPTPPPVAAAAAPSPDAPSVELEPASKKPDEPKELPAADPIKPVSMRERLLEKQTKEPLHAEIANLRSQLASIQQQQSAGNQRVQELLRAGKVDEAAQAALGLNLESIQRMHLEQKGAIEKRNADPEVAAMRAKLEAFERAQQEQAARAQQEQARQLTLQQQAEFRRGISAEMEASGYADVQRLAKVEGFVTLVSSSIQSKPELDNEHHYRQAKTKLIAMTEQLNDALYPGWREKLQATVPAATGATPQQASVQPAAPPVAAQPGAPPVQPRVPAVPTALPQTGSVELGKRSRSSNDEEWNALKRERGWV